MNISRMTNLNAGGARARKTAQCVYSLCHDTIRTQILNCSQSGRNHKFGTAVQFQHGQKPTVLCWVWVTTHKDSAGQFFGWVRNLTELNFAFKPGPLASYPETLLILPSGHAKDMVETMILTNVMIAATKYHQPMVAGHMPPVFLVVVASTHNVSGSNTPEYPWKHIVKSDRDCLASSECTR
jgi:hypothetical protein